MSRSILLADPDPATARRLGTALRARGHKVLTVRDGSKALEVAVMRVPDVVLYDVDCPLLEPQVFSQILRANPRTASIPLIAVGPEEAAERIRAGLRETFIQKPFNVDEVLSRIQQLLRRAEAAEAVRREGAIEGSLAQILLADVLQILSANRRSGALHIKPVKKGGESGEVIIRDGRVIDAKTGPVGGEKALYRILGFRTGNFSFDPGSPKGPVRIDISMDEVLLEGMRQKDEVDALEGRAPGADEELALAVDLERLPEGLHPVTREILDLVARHRRTGAVVDNATATDLEALRALTTLVERGLVKVLGKAGRARAGKRLVAPEVAYALHGRHAGPAGHRVALLRVLASSPEPGALRALVADLERVEGWTPAAPAAGALDLGLGDLGTVRLAETVEVLVVALPAAEPLRPLWPPFGAGAVGGVLLARDEEDSGALQPLAAYLVEQGLPVAVVGPAPEVLTTLGRLGAPAPTPGDGLARLLERVSREGPAKK